MAFPDVDVSVVFDGLLHLIHVAIRNINDLLAPMPSSVSCSFYADDLTIWSFFVSVPTAAEATQGALIRLERCSAYWHVPLNLSKCEAPYSQSILIKLTSSPTSSYSIFASVSVPLQLFLGSPSTAFFPFLNVYLR